MSRNRFTTFVAAVAFYIVKFYIIAEIGLRCILPSYNLISGKIEEYYAFGGILWKEFIENIIFVLIISSLYLLVFSIIYKKLNYIILIISAWIDGIWIPFSIFLIPNSSVTIRWFAEYISVVITAFSFIFCCLASFFHVLATAEKRRSIIRSYQICAVTSVVLLFMSLGVSFMRTTTYTARLGFILIGVVSLILIRWIVSEFNRRIAISADQTDQTNY